MVVFFDINIDSSTKCTDLINPLDMDIILNPSLVDPSIHYFYNGQNKS